MFFQQSPKDLVHGPGHNPRTPRGFPPSDTAPESHDRPTTLQTRYHFNLPACWGGTKAEAEAMRAKKAKRRIILNVVLYWICKQELEEGESAGRLVPEGGRKAATKPKPSSREPTRFALQRRILRVSTTSVVSQVSRILCFLKGPGARVKRKSSKSANQKMQARK